MTTTTLPTEARIDTSWLRLTLIGIGAAIVGLLMMGLTMLFARTSDQGEFQYASDYVLTVAALPQGAGLVLATLGFHRLQRGRDGKLGSVGVWVYSLCITALVIQCMASVVAGAELRWGPAYPVCAFGAGIGIALLAAGSWRVGLVPRWMLGVWPPLAVIGSFLGVGPIPLVFAAFLVLLGFVLARRVRDRSV